MIPVPEGRARSRLYEIDLLRFIAAGLVVGYHYTYFGPAAGLIPPTLDAVAGPARYGGLGVNLFFLISGFVIMMTAEEATPWRFAVSRAVRLYPAYWVCCTATFLGLHALPHPAFHVPLREYLWNLSMVSPAAGVDYVDGVYWSLLVELRFYVLVFGLLACGLLRHLRVILGVWLAVTVLAHYHLAETRVTNLLLVTDWSAYFIAGAMCHHVRARGRWDSFAAIVVAVCLVMAADGAVAAAGAEARALGTWSDTRVVVLAIATFFLAFVLIAQDWTARLRAAWFVPLGGLTYPLYLLHQRLGFTLLERGRGAAHPQMWLWGVTAIVLAAAYGVYRFVEPAIATPLRGLLTTPPWFRPRPSHPLAPHSPPR